MASHELSMRERYCPYAALSGMGHRPEPVSVALYKEISAFLRNVATANGFEDRDELLLRYMMHSNISVHINPTLLFMVPL